MVTMYMKEDLWFNKAVNLNQATNDYDYNMGQLAELRESHLLISICSYNLKNRETNSII